MNEIELTVSRQSRILIGIIVLGISAPVLFIIGVKIDIPMKQILLPMTLIFLVFGLLHFFIIGKLIIRYSENTLDFEWKKRILFENNVIKPVSINEIKTLVVDEGVYLRKIITNNRIIEINNIKTTKDDFHLFLENLILTVENNNGKVINSKKYSEQFGYNDFSFHTTIILLTASIFLISRLWQLIEFYSLFFLLLPLFSYLRHVNLRIRKKNSNKLHL